MMLFAAVILLYLLMEVFVFVMVQRFSIQQDLSLLRFVQPLQEADAGRLPAAGGADQCCHLPWLKLHRNRLYRTC